MAEIPALYSQRPIVLRHERAALYHPFIEALALTLVDVPLTFLTTIVFSIILYFMTGLQRTASQFLYVTSSIQVALVLINVHVASLYCSCLPCLLL
jgi:ATP-binding cassette subfamily G (WHITE) protein 2 (SNQ2)